MNCQISHSYEIGLNLPDFTNRRLTCESRQNFHPCRYIVIIIVIEVVIIIIYTPKADMDGSLMDDEVGEGGKTSI